jgi:two-component system, sensor histidine kinase
MISRKNCDSFGTQITLPCRGKLAHHLRAHEAPVAEISSIAHRLVQVSPDALLVVDEQGVIQFSNETSIGLFGYAPDLLIGQPIRLLIPERFHVRHVSHVSNYLENPTNREMGARINDLFARRADGSEFPAGIHLSPFREVGSSFVAVAVRDMTERRQISDALVAAREEADRANRAKSRFLATASHDLRQPLQAIRLINASMQKYTQETPELKSLVGHQELAIDSATRLLNALLDISRLESGAIEPHLSPVSLDAAFADIVGEFALVAEAKHLRLEFVETGIVLSTDRVLFTQLLQNLIGNSIKYTDHGYVSIHHGFDDEVLILKIEDTGVGISEDKLGRIFDEYYQIGPQGTQRLGVGLGLAIVREVTRLLGYTVLVSSTVGTGTCVNVHIPANRLLSSTLPVPGKAFDVAKLTRSGACRLLLLEDNESVRTATELFLSLEGFEVRSAGSTIQAESLLANARAGDILITDYHLDGMLTGLDVLRQLRARHQRDVPAILMSGDLQSMLRAVKTAIPQCRFLSKPVDSKALLSAIYELSSN